MNEWSIIVVRLLALEQALEQAVDHIGEQDTQETGPGRDCYQNVWAARNSIRTAVWMARAARVAEAARAESEALASMKEGGK